MPVCAFASPILKIISMLHLTCPLLCNEGSSFLVEEEQAVLQKAALPNTRGFQDAHLFQVSLHFQSMVIR